MLAAQYQAFGDADVLSVGEAPEPHAGPGQVRIAVVASSVNPIDWKVRRGYMAEVMPMAFPIVPGQDAAGVVDEVGEGVEGVTAGDEVFGIGPAANAEYVVLDGWTAKPPSMSWEVAASAGLPLETAGRAIEDLGVGTGDVILVEGASGAVGRSAVQLARRRGASVIGTASEHNHDLLRDLGASAATTYGPGLAERLAELGTGPVTGVLDTAGSGSIAELVGLVSDPQQVVSVADFAAPAHGARVVRPGPRAYDALAEGARAYEAGEHRFDVDRVFALADIAEAHRLSETGHPSGKIVLSVRPDA